MQKTVRAVVACVASLGDRMVVVVVVVGPASCETSSEIVPALVA